MNHTLFQNATFDPTKSKDQKLHFVFLGFFPKFGHMAQTHNNEFRYAFHISFFIFLIGLSNASRMQF